MSDRQAPNVEYMACQSCGSYTEAKIVNVTMWTEKGLVLIENVPARVCNNCEEQFYDEGTGAQILQLASSGFPRRRMVREITVPVYSLDEPQSENAGKAQRKREEHDAH